jgi:hypothetical protein
MEPRLGLQVEMQMEMKMEIGCQDKGSVGAVAETVGTL